MQRNSKLLIGAIVVATIAVMAMSMGSATAEKISPGELTEDHVGEDVIVEGRVGEINRSDGVQFTLLGNSSGSLSVVVPSDVDVPPTLEQGRIAVVKATYTTEGLRAYDITVRAHQNDGQN